MRRTRFVCLSLAGLGLAIFTAACGGSDAVTGTDESSPAAPASAPGNAVLQGTVEGAGEGLRVALAGTSRATSTDEDGQFALSGLPSGTVTLQLQGGSVDASLAVSNLQDGKVTSVRIKASGSSAQMTTTPTCNPTEDTFFSGTIQSINGTRMRVADRTVDLSQLRKVWRGSQRMQVGDLKVGEKIKVWGKIQGDGVVMADEIVLMASLPGEDGTTWVAFRGKITAVKGTSRDTVSQLCLYPTLVVDGKTVYTGEGTSFTFAGGGSYDGAELKVGMVVYVEGWKKADGAVRAKLVQR